MKEQREMPLTLDIAKSFTTRVFTQPGPRAAIYQNLILYAGFRIRDFRIRQLPDLGATPMLATIQYLFEPAISSFLR
jgi:hypothetical protein